MVVNMEKKAPACVWGWRLSCILTVCHPASPCYKQSAGNYMVQMHQGAGQKAGIADRVCDSLHIGMCAPKPTTMAYPTPWDSGGEPSKKEVALCRRNNAQRPYDPPTVRLPVAKTGCGHRQATQARARVIGHPTHHIASSPRCWGPADAPAWRPLALAPPAPLRPAETQPRGQRNPRRVRPPHRLDAHPPTLPGASELPRKA